jgi:branched-chain amino acid transport system substrate-binding protein
MCWITSKKCLQTKFVHLCALISVGLILGGYMIVKSPAVVHAQIQGPEIKIGILQTVEGMWGTAGKLTLAGCRIGAKQVNASGGIKGVPIKLFEYDNHAKIEEVARIMTRLITVDKVLAIVGPGSSAEAEIAFPVANRLKTPMVAPACAKGGLMEKNRPYAFRIVMPDDANTAPVIEKVVKEKNIKSIAIIVDVKDAFNKFMGTEFYPELFKRAGVMNLTEKDQVTFQGGDPSVAVQVTKLKALNPNALVIASTPADAGKIAAEIRAQGMTQQILGGGGIFAEGDVLIRAGGKAVEGMITAAQFWREDPDPEVQKLVREMEAELGEAVDLQSAYGRDALVLVAEAIKSSGATNRSNDLEKDRARIQQVLDSGIKIKGVSGVLALVPKTGEVSRPIMMATVVNQRWKVEVIRTVK